MRLFFAGIFLFLSSFSFCQINHAPGELLVQFSDSSNPNKVLENYREVNGVTSGVKLIKLVSKHMNIYAVEFTALEQEHAIKRAISADPDVTICQFNHYVQSRETVPNDPMLEEQWHHINDDNNGGTDDADIDSDLAWDITTGGLTAAGDTIVVCVIEGGNLNHPDLIENAWFNYNEIPDNDIDDDGNGYVDDFRGWNVNSGDDNGVYEGDHGTSVMGMIGASGNNNLGVAGANWNVKIMTVAGGMSSEQAVVAAYSYALAQRQLYDASNGLRGAFVVATNTSFGIEGGNPDDVPIWSAFYDTLGQYGILNCGATVNNNVNVDVVGDIPTAAESDYMISVTATNNNDVRTSSGYGAETIDLGAPGEIVTTTTGSNGYTSTSGTSLASPLTAGVIGLMYSIPCDDFIQAVHDNPQFGADYVRQMLFDGVDPIENLEFETVTGGRLNANNSIELMMGQCGSDVCLPPSNFEVSIENDTIYTFSWSMLGDNQSVLRMRQVGNSTWTYIESPDATSLVIDTLATCAEYEFEIANNCAAGPLEDLEYDSYISFETAGCCVQTTDVDVGEVAHTTAEIMWSQAFEIDSYEVYYRVLGDLSWEYAGDSENGFFLIENLLECNDYQVNVLPACSDDLLFGTVSAFRTKGCGACLDADYCTSFGESTEAEYIDKIQIGDFVNESGNNGGYLFSETSELSLEVAGDYEVVLSPGFIGGAQYAEYFTLWIDLNQNGDFETSEILVQSGGGSFNPVSTTIEIPASTLVGNTRLRVQMKYIGNGSPGNIAGCDVLEYGETEDYCLTILDSTVGISEAEKNIDLAVFPNPSNGNISVQIDDLQNNQVGYSIQFYDLLGRQLSSEPLSNRITELKLDLNAGMYLFIVSDTYGQNLHTGKLTIE